MIFILSVIDVIISLYWIFSYIIFQTAQKIFEANNFCLVFSVIYLFIFTFTFVYLFCILLHFTNLNFNSIDSILKPQKILIKYFSISGGISLAEVILAGVLKQLGRSVSPYIYTYIITVLSLANDDLFRQNRRSKFNRRI